MFSECKENEIMFSKNSNFKYKKFKEIKLN